MPKGFESLRTMKLNDEKKFFVNKNLFENSTLRIMAPLNSLDTEKPKESTEKEDVLKETI